MATMRGLLVPHDGVAACAQLLMTDFVVGSQSAVGIQRDQVGDAL